MEKIIIHIEEIRNMSRKKEISKNGYLSLGIVTAIIALILLPPVFGFASIFCGAQLYRKYDERIGLAILILGGSCMILGMMIGAITGT